MGEWITLTAADGHALSAWMVQPAETAKGAIVILQEIFGITAHIRAVAEGYAADGYAVIAPALFDRVRPGVELSYSDIPGGKAIVEQLDPAKAMADVAAAVDRVRPFGKVAIVGYCWGGTLAHLASAGGIADAAIAYYGGMVARFVDKKPAIPTIYHFGGQDAHIPQSDVKAVAAAFGADVVHVYDDAGHGFNCNERPDYRADAAALARARTLSFLELHVAATA